MNKKFFMFIHRDPVFLLYVESKKEGVQQLKDYFKVNPFFDGTENISEIVVNGSYSSIARLLFYVEIIDYKNDIVFHTFRLKSDSSISKHITYNIAKGIIYFDFGHQLLPEKCKIVTQYKAIMRKLRIENLLKNG